MVTYTTFFKDVAGKANDNTKLLSQTDKQEITDAVVSGKVRIFVFIF